MKRIQSLQRAVLRAGVCATTVLGLCTSTRSHAQPSYPHGQFREDCSLCHRPDGWKPARIKPAFDHARYGFKLEGAHSTAECRLCHVSLDFASAPTACIDCHKDVHQGELGSDCSRCHGTRSFVDRGDQVRMHRLTRFPLAGAHTALDCESCHELAAPGALTYVKTPTRCEECHLRDFQATTNPDHAAGGFSHDCSSCHTDIAWARTNFDHGATGFPLTGAHQSLACSGCHAATNFQGLSPACVSCHQPDYNGTTNPAHGPAGFPTDCTQCHSTIDWRGATFDHARTGFPLTGAHTSVQCTTCHAGGNWTGLSPNCVSCHQGDYDGTTDPPHAAAGFPTDCVSCHGTITWAGATFDHDAQNFPIYSGTHRGRWSSCSTCHLSTANWSQFTCLSCHPHDDRAETDGHHQGEAGYSYDSVQCYRCHPRGRS